MTKVAIITEALESTPIDVERILYPLFANENHQESAPETDLFKEILDLMLLRERHFNTCLSHIGYQDLPNPAVTQAPQDSEVSSRKSLRAMAHSLKINREQTIIRLRALTMKEWQSKVNHETRGQITVRLLAQELVEHDIARCNQLVQMMGAWRDNQRLPYDR